MKKIIFSIVAIALILCTFTSCGGNEDTLAAYNSALAKTNPAEAIISVSVNTAIGTLNGTVTITYNEDGSSVIVYSYEQFNPIASGADEKSTVSGQITCDKDGNYSGSISGVVSLSVALKLNLDTKLLDDVRFDDNVCSVLVKAENNLAVLGVALGADAKLVLFRTDDVISSYTLAFSNENGSVSIACEYN